MGKVFEDEFMELQTGLISLCLELARGKVDKVFAYCSNEKKTKSFNAFFEVDGSIKTTNQLDVPGDLIDQFLKLGTGDVMNLDAIGKKHHRPVPTEMKLYDILWEDGEIIGRPRRELINYERKENADIL